MTRMEWVAANRDSSMFPTSQDALDAFYKVSSDFGVPQSSTSSVSEGTLEILTELMRRVIALEDRPNVAG